MAPWTAADIPDQHGRTSVVTGANSGIGFHTALELARHGSHLILACRDMGRGGEAMERIRGQIPHANVELAQLDLADLASVRAFAAATTRVDVLINNAGVMAIPRRETRDGFEMQIGTNHLGHFALTMLLLPHGVSRVVTVSSHAARLGRIRWNDLQSTRWYQRWMAYAQSKLANQLFAYELARRYPAVASMAAHPGYSSTNLGGGRLYIRLGNALAAQPEDMGALPTLYAAVAGESGAYYGPDGLFEGRGHPTRVTPPRQARDTRSAARLWDLSLALTGVI